MRPDTCLRSCIIGFVGFVGFVGLVLLSPVQAQEFADPLLNRLTEVHPGYDPFVPPLPPDRYFPDAVGKQIAKAIADAYVTGPQSLDAHVHALSERDAELVRSGQRPTGLTAYIEALAATGDPASPHHIVPDVAAAELDAPADALLAQADRLIADEKRGRLGRVFNWLLSTFDVGSLFLGAPRSPSPYSAQGVISSLRRRGDGPSPRERKALVLYQQFLRRAPDDPRVAEVREKVQALETRRQEALLDEELDKAKAAFEQHDYWAANFHYQLALMVDDESAQAQTGLRQVEARLQVLEPLADRRPEDPYQRVRDATWDHRFETFKYIMPGSEFVKDNFAVAGIQVATEGLVGAATFGALSMVQFGGKLWRVMTGNPVSRQGVIREAQTYVHQTPPERRTPEVYDLLANSYQREGKLDRAMHYYQLAGQEDKIPDLEEQAADALLHQADETPHRADKLAALRTLAERYPDTEAAKEAAPKLRELSRWEHQGLQLSKAFLQEHTDLIGPRGLGLRPQLVDGDWENIELSDEGITVLADQEISLHFATDAGSQTKVYGVPRLAWERFWQRFRAKGFEQAARHGDRQLARLALGAEETDIVLKSSQEKHADQGWRALPQLTGSTSGTDLDIRGILPKEVIGTNLAFGKDQRSAFVGVEVPLPFVPVDFLLLGRSGMPSLYPKIRTPDGGLNNEELYQ